MSEVESLLKDAIWLAKQDFKYYWIAVILTFVVSILFGGAVGLILSKSGNFVFEINTITGNRFVLDFIFIGMAPSFATIFMSRPYLSYRVAKHDPFGKRMAVLRTLPIPVSVLALSRTVLMLSTLFLMSLGFYGTMATVIFFLDGFFGVMTAGEFIEFMFVWLGFMLALGGMNPFIEYGTNGRVLHILPLVFVILIIIGITTFYSSTGQGIVEKSLDLVRNIGWPIAAFSIVIGGICAYLWNKLLKNRLENRDYL